MSPTFRPLDLFPIHHNDDRFHITTSLPWKQKLHINYAQPETTHVAWYSSYLAISLRLVNFIYLYSLVMHAKVDKNIFVWLCVCLVGFWGDIYRYIQRLATICLTLCISAIRYEYIPLRERFVLWELEAKRTWGYTLSHMLDSRMYRRMTQLCIFIFQHITSFILLLPFLQQLTYI